MKQTKFNLSDLIEEGKIDSISGRRFGEGYAKKIKLLELLHSKTHIVLVIPSDKIKAINDSFWKGFFSAAFNEYKSKERINTFFTFETDDFYKNMIEKNLTILDSIYSK